MAKFDEIFDKSTGDDYIPKKGLTSDMYGVEIEDAYFIKANSGAEAVTLHLKLNDKFNQKITIYFTNKKGENFYKDKEGKKAANPGFMVLNELAFLASKGKKSLGSLYGDAKKKMHAIDEWNDDKKKFLPVERKLLTPPKLIGFEGHVLISIIREFGFKDGKEDKSRYRDTVNIKAFLDKKQRSYNEVATEKKASYAKKWLEVYQGSLYDKTDGAFDKKDNLDENEKF